MSLERYVARRQRIDDQPPGHSRRKAQVKMPQRAPFKIRALKTFYPRLYKKQLDAFLAKNYTNLSEVQASALTAYDGIGAGHSVDGLPGATACSIAPEVETGRLSWAAKNQGDMLDDLEKAFGVILDAKPDNAHPISDDYEEITYVDPNSGNTAKDFE